MDGKGMAGSTFNKHLLGDVLRALQPRYLSQLSQSISGNVKGPMTNIQLSPLLEYDNKKESINKVSTWTELQQQWTQQSSGSSSQTRSFRDELNNGLVHSALANKRVFTTTNEANYHITFYKDSASWCPYCQKVWIALEELELNYDIVPVDMNCYAGSSKSSEFLAVQPSGSLPCLVLTKNTKDPDVTNNDANNNESDTSPIILGESEDILIALDQLKRSLVNHDDGHKDDNDDFLGRYLLPKEGNVQEWDQMKELCMLNGRNSLERRLYAEWMWYLTGKRKPAEYRQRYEAVLDEVESVLSQSSGNFFLGKHLSMVDIVFAPFLERQEATLYYFKGFQMRNKERWPNLQQWFQAMEQRDSYIQTKSDFYTHSRAVPPQISAESVFDPSEEYVPCQKSVDVYCLPTEQILKDGLLSCPSMSWKEPGWEEDDTTARTTLQQYRLEASERILHNHEKICKFAARAAGLPGLPACSAPLADPKSQSNQEIVMAVDFFLRMAIHNLLRRDNSQYFPLSSKEGDSSASTTISANPTLKGAAEALADGGLGTVEATIACLDYLRQRIGVPRDMSYPAARELRSELLYISIVLKQECDDRIEDGGLSTNVSSGVHDVVEQRLAV